jgi:DNA-directed RNA polymerase subunit N (RpoN/RPB10)
MTTVELANFVEESMVSNEAHRCFECGTEVPEHIVACWNCGVVLDENIRKLMKIL